MSPRFFQWTLGEAGSVISPVFKPAIPAQGEVKEGKGAEAHAAGARLLSCPFVACSSRSSYLCEMRAACFLNKIESDGLGEFLPKCWKLTFSFPAWVVEFISRLAGWGVGLGPARTIFLLRTITLKHSVRSSAGERNEKTILGTVVGEENHYNPRRYLAPAWLPLAAILLPDWLAARPSCLTGGSRVGGRLDISKMFASLTKIYLHLCISSFRSSLLIRNRRPDLIAKRGENDHLVGGNPKRAPDGSRSGIGRSQKDAGQFRFSGYIEFPGNFVPQNMAPRGPIFTGNFRTERPLRKCKKPQPKPILTEATTGPWHQAKGLQALGFRVPISLRKCAQSR